MGKWIRPPLKNQGNIGIGKVVKPTHIARFLMRDICFKAVAQR